MPERKTTTNPNPKMPSIILGPSEPQLICRYVPQRASVMVRVVAFAFASVRRALSHWGPCAAMVGICSCGQAPEPPSVADCVVPVGDSPARGPDDALVTIVEFADFQCPYCGDAESTIATVDSVRPGLRWVFKHFPLTMAHAYAMPAALAAECANEQGMFWPMHDLLFANQTRLFESSLVAYAETLGLDMQAWNNCRISGEASARIAADFDLGVTIGVGGTPAFFINGKALPGAYPVGDFLERIDAAASTAQRSGIAPVSYYASIEKQGCTGL
jgi:protein-disulfide isomerase